MLLYHQSNNSENLPGGSGFIPQDRFTYLTVGIISVTLLLGILFPQSKYHVNKQNILKAKLNIDAALFA